MIQPDLWFPPSTLSTFGFCVGVFELGSHASRLVLNSILQLRMSLNFSDRPASYVPLCPVYSPSFSMLPVYRLSYSPSPAFFLHLTTSPGGSNSTNMRCARACAQPHLPVQEVQLVHGCQPCGNLARHPLQ